MKDQGYTEKCCNMSELEIFHEMNCTKNTEVCQFFFKKLIPCSQKTTLTLYGIFSQKTLDITHIEDALKLLKDTAVPCIVSEVLTLTYSILHLGYLQQNEDKMRVQGKNNENEEKKKFRISLILFNSGCTR